VVHSGTLSNFESLNEEAKMWESIAVTIYMAIGMLFMILKAYYCGRGPVDTGADALLDIVFWPIVLLMGTLNEISQYFDSKGRK